MLSDLLLTLEPGLSPHINGHDHWLVGIDPDEGGDDEMATQPLLCLSLPRA